MKPNIILITIDSLRADRFSSLGYHRQITPNLEKIAEKGCFFTQAISVGSNTRISFPGILASMYPFIFLQVSEDKYMQIPEEVMTITEILKEQGYCTFAYNANALLTYNRNYHKGFDFCEGLFEKEKFRIIKRGLLTLERIITKKPVKSYAIPAQINKKVISLLKDRRSPFFLWLHHLEIHVPYVPPKKVLNDISSEGISYSEMAELYRKLERPSTITDKDLQKIIDLYDAEVKYLDHCIGDFIEQLKDIGVNFNNTFFIMTSDHGDEFKEHGGLVHSAKLYDELIRVPLIIVGPGLNQRTIKEQVSLLNIPPTILSLVSKKDYPFFQGKSILSLMVDGVGGEEYVISEGCVEDRKSVLPRAVNERISCRSLSWKYIHNYNGADELYSLTQDPAETVNLVNDKEEISKNFKQKIQEHLEREKALVIRLKEARRIKAIVKSKGLKKI